MRKLRTFQPNGLWLVAGSAVLWGTIGVATQAIYNVDSTSSLFINLARMVIAAPVLLAACWRVVGREMFNIQQRDFVIMAASGTLLALSHAAYFAAIRYTGVTIATLLTICVAPLAVACLSAALKLERLTGRIVITLICGVIGSVLLVGFHSPEGSDYRIGLGAMFSLIAAISYASMIICGRFLAVNYHPLQITSAAFAAGTMALVVINVAIRVEATHTTQGWLLLLYLGLIPTALAYWLLQMGLRSVSATAASIVNMVDPLVAALLAWALFGETLAITGIGGAALLILSIFLLSAGE